jgi:diadenosine tetraphosphate (Ap4A) HIT family hydrolase
MALDRLWAGWRRAYVETVNADEPVETAAPAPGAGRAALVDPEWSGTLFEGILRLGDEEGYIVHRGARCSVMLNAFPYGSGHLLVLPDRAVTRLAELDGDEHRELWDLVRDGVNAVEEAYGCDGVNVGVNQGTAAGAGVPDHLHVHVLPRWHGDTNFTTAIAETRVMPETLRDTWRKVRAAWPPA